MELLSSLELKGGVKCLANSMQPLTIDCQRTDNRTRKVQRADAEGILSTMAKVEKTMVLFLNSQASVALP